MDRYASFFERRRGVVAALVVLVTVAFAGAIRTLRVDDVAINIFRSEGEDFRRLEQLFADFGADDRDVLVVFEADDWFTPAGAAILRDATDEIAALKGVERVFGLDDLVVLESGGLLPLPRRVLPDPAAPLERFESARAEAQAHPLGGDQTLSRDGHTTLVVATLTDGLSSTRQIGPVVGEIREIARRYAGSAGARARARLTGVPTIRVQILDVVVTENARLFFLALGLGLLVALVVFRNLGALAAAGLAACCAAIWGVGAIALTDGTLDLMKTALPSVVMIIALTDGVHLVMDARFQRAAGLGRVPAAGAAIRHVGAACFLTSLTTAVGFGSLAVGSIQMIRGFGIATAIAVGMAFLTVLTIAPLLTTLVRDLGPPGGGPGSLARRAADWIYGPIDRHAGVVVALGIGGTLLLLVLALRLEPDNRLTEASPRDEESFQALTHLDEVFGGAMFAGVVLEWDEDLALESPEVLAALGEAADAARATTGFSGVVSLLDVLELIPGELAARLALRENLPEELVSGFVRPDLRRALVRARMPDLPSSESEAVSSALEERLREVEARHPGVRAHLTGTAIVARRNIDRMIIDFVTGLGVAAILIFIVLSIALRSPVLGLLSLVPNAFPIVFAAAFLHVTGQTLQMANAMSFTILLGIAVDDTVHLLMRFKAELEDCGDVHEAAHRAVLRVGAALMTTTTILLAGFAGMLTSAVPTNHVMGIVCLLGFVAALVGDLVFLPALLIRFVPRPRSRDSS